MTLQIHRPELEELIQQWVNSGRHEQIEDVLLQALRSTPLEAQSPNSDKDNDLLFGKRLIEVCAMISGLTDDVDFSRNPSFDRPLDLS